MTVTRRTFLKTSAAAGSITVLPFLGHAGGHLPNEFKTPGGMVKVHPVNHASVVLETPKGTIYVDPVGDPAQYADFPNADLILITHEHGDHFNNDTLTALAAGGVPLITNPAVHGKLARGLTGQATAMANGDSATVLGVGIDAIPAYNLSEERKNFHPQGRDNGYVLSLEGFRIYLSGDTEDIPEMRDLKDIDLAFVCMNLPFTMDANAAASAVREFRPTYVYPYHYRGRGDGTQDPQAFAEMVGDAAIVKFGDWY
jgi:L-ascorbate metabolism protein UlaG (beta-lactamase superfamily)